MSYYLCAVAPGTGGAGGHIAEVSVCSGAGVSDSTDDDKARSINSNC